MNQRHRQDAKTHFWAQKREQDKRVLHSAALLISSQARQWETHMTIFKEINKNV